MIEISALTPWGRKVHYWDDAKVATQHIDLNLNGIATITLMRIEPTPPLAASTFTPLEPVTPGAHINKVVLSHEAAIKELQEIVAAKLTEDNYYKAKTEILEEILQKLKDLD